MLALRAIPEVRPQTSLVDVQHSARILPPGLSICTPDIIIPYAVRDEVVTFQAPVALAEKLRALAHGNDRSLSPEVRRACDLLLRIENAPAATATTGDNSMSKLSEVIEGR